MAAPRTKNPAIGSTQWIQNERQQAEQFVEQEVEEFSYSVRNEMEFLNVYMEQIFSDSQMAFPDIFKTPGKLRGKTPRTARKQNVPGQQRQPLTDIFAPNVPMPTSATKNTFLDKVAQFQIPEDASHASPGQRPKSRGKSPQRAGKSGYTDSGYHGMTEDEMDVDGYRDMGVEVDQENVIHTVPLRENQPRPQPVRIDTAEAGGTSDDSFVSAKEGLSGKITSKDEGHEARQPEVVPDNGGEMDVDHEIKDFETQPADTQEMEIEEMDEALKTQEPDVVMSGSASETSSPEKPLQRKSSFTFAALPAREPLTAKRSSQADGQSSRASALGRSFGSKSLGRVQNEEEDEYAADKPEASKAHNKTSTQSLHERIMMLGKTKEPRPSKSIPQNVLNAQQTYNQLPADDDAVVHNQAGKAVVLVDDSDDDWIAPSKPQDKGLETGKAQQGDAESSLARPNMHLKSLSTTQVPSPSRLDMAPYPSLEKAQTISKLDSSSTTADIHSTTPAGSPPKKQHDGPLSASKNRLYSVLKSAKSIFASSASASAAAKLEAHSNSPSRSPTRSPRREGADDSKTAGVLNMPGALYSEKELHASPTRPLSIISAISRSPSKKSARSSVEKRDKDLKAQQKADEELEKAREKERQRAAKEQDERMKAEQAEAFRKEQEQKSAAQTERPTTAGSNQSTDGERPTTSSSKSLLPSGKLRAPTRLGKPTREGAQSSKPAPMSIRVASQSQRLGQASTLSKSQHESSAAPPAPPAKSSFRPSSAQGNARSSTAPSNSRVKALEAAARKKEADERAAQKKAEQKRELERKRAAKAEEERRAEEERKAAEQQRIQEAKLLAQKNAEKQAAEAKRREQLRLEQQRKQEQVRLEQQRLAEQQRLEQQRQLEQQRREEEADKARAAHDLAEAIKRERNAQAAAHPRGDVGGTLRQLTKNTVMEGSSSRSVLQPNPAKPVKRALQPEEEGMVSTYHPQQVPPPQRPGVVRGPPSYQQNEAKRRRTNEEEPEERKSVMAPPKRPSNMRKESTLSKFPYGYAHAPPPAAHHGQSMFKAALTSQHQLQHSSSKPMMPGAHPSQMVQISNARIPFADNPNPQAVPPQTSYQPQTYQPNAPQQQQYHGGENYQQPAPGQNKYKTPVRAPQHFAPGAAKSAAKSSPMYPNGDSIALPEIQTDSEDEDSEDEDNNTGFRAPSWVASPALRDLLTQQQLVDPESVFGPISELKMDEVFRNGKNAERLKRFRDRGSSAAWVETGDAVTSAEKRRDMELRERVVRDGGWRYDPNV